MSDRMNDLPEETSSHTSCKYCVCKTCFDNCNKKTGYDGCYNCADCMNYENHTEGCSMYDNEDEH